MAPPTVRLSTWWNVIGSSMMKPQKKRKNGVQQRFYEPASVPQRLAADRNYKGKQLQLDFMVEDEGVFTMPWSATINYRRSFGEWPEHVCAENTRWSPGKDGAVPAADKPDF